MKTLLYINFNKNMFCEPHDNVTNYAFLTACNCSVRN